MIQRACVWGGGGGGYFYEVAIVVRIITARNRAAGEAMKKQQGFGRVMSLSAVYFQGSAMAAMGE